MVFNIKNNVSLAKFTQWSILNYVSESADFCGGGCRFAFDECEKVKVHALGNTWFDADAYGMSLSTWIEHHRIILKAIMFVVVVFVVAFSFLCMHYSMGKSLLFALLAVVVIVAVAIFLIGKSLGGVH